MKFTDEQLKVIAHRTGAALLLAVAGAGKTTVLLALIKAFIDDAGIDPRDILMTTFSKRGAEDMARRAATMAVPAGVQFRTLHSYAFEMLREVKTRRGIIVPKDWQVIRVIRDTLKAMAGTRTQLPKPGDVLREIGLAKAALIWPKTPTDAGEWKAWDGQKFLAYLEWATSRDRNPLDTKTADIMNACYTAVEVAGQAPESAGFKDDAGGRWVTFDDMIAITAKAILQGAAWTKRSRGRFARVLVDEVQDNNLGQWVMVEHLACHDNVIAVGDDQQSIFGFRGAQPALMREFLARHPQATVYNLSYNFRCGQKVLDAANGVLRNAKDRLFQGELLRGRGPEAVGQVTASSFTDSEEEATQVVGQIVLQIDAGRSPDDIAVLYRLNAQSGPLELALIRRGIKYRVAGSSFFSRGEIKTAIGYLGCALNETDAKSFKACYGTPLRGIGRAFLEACPTVAATRDAIRDSSVGRWARGARELVGAIDGIKIMLEKSLGDALAYIFDTVGVRKHYRDESADEESETETDIAIDCLFACASSQTAEELVQFARDMARTGHEDHDGQRDVVARVTLSTVHKAKGLEWESVFVAGMSKGTFPFVKAPVDEERRLAYVALTRARDVLEVSYTERTLKGPAGPSPFLQEAALVASNKGQLAAPLVVAPQN